jgi:glutathione S-transferase
MRLSHYCEKARWRLDRTGFPYREESHAPLVHRIFTTRNQGSSVPVLLHESKSLTDSAQILAYVDATSGGGVLYPHDATLRQEVEAWEAKLDRGLGPHVRRWAYGYLLSERKLLAASWSQGVPRAEAALVPLVLPVARLLIRRGYRISPDAVEHSFARVGEVFAEVAARLKDNGRYLVGDRFSAADLTFAALAAPVLFPAECRAAMPVFEVLPAAMQKDIVQFRETAAGQFALRLYQRERNVKVAGDRNVHVSNE